MKRVRATWTRAAATPSTRPSKSTVWKCVVTAKARESAPANSFFSTHAIHPPARTHPRASTRLRERERDFRDRRTSKREENPRRGVWKPRSASTNLPPALAFSRQLSTTSKTPSACAGRRQNDREIRIHSRRAHTRSSRNARNRERERETLTLTLTRE